MCTYAITIRLSICLVVPCNHFFAKIYHIDLDDGYTEVNCDSISELIGIAVSTGFSEEITSHALADMRRRGKNINPFVISTAHMGLQSS